MATVMVIEEALKQIDTKKVKLKEAYDELQSYTSLLVSSTSSFSCPSWSEIDSYVSSVQSSLTARFMVVKNEERVGSVLKSDGLNVPVVEKAEKVTEEKRVKHVMIRPELKSLCERRDGMGLRNYIIEHLKEGDEIRAEVSRALQWLPDGAGTMVLDAMVGFFCDSKGDRNGELCKIRRGCSLLLEQFMGNENNLGKDVRDRAKKLAMEWKGKVTTNGENPLESLGFLNLVVAFGLKSEFDLNELVDYFVIAARYRQAIVLCKTIDLGDKVPELIQRLIDNGKLLLSVKFVLEFGLKERFPPTELLQSYLKESKRLSNEVCKNGKNSQKSQNEATAGEISAIKLVLKVIDDHKLDHEFPRGNLEKRVELLRKRKSPTKLAPSPSPLPPASKPPSQRGKRKQPRGGKNANKNSRGGNKHPRTIASVSTSQQPYLQQVGSVQGYTVPYPNSASGPTYGLASSAYGSSSGVYGGYTGANVGYSENLNPNPNPNVTYMYPSELQVGRSYYDQQTSYGGYVVPQPSQPPQYHPSYYPE